MTREQIIKAVYDNDEMWSCPDHPCDKPEKEKTLDCCLKCSEMQVAEYEDKIRADATRWIPIKTMPLTEEEKQEFENEWYEFMYDCELPDHGQEVLVQSRYGIAMTTFYTDAGCYFENYEDVDDVIAWMPLPEPYREEQKP